MIFSCACERRAHSVCVVLDPSRAMRRCTRSSRSMILSHFPATSKRDFTMRSETEASARSSQWYLIFARPTSVRDERRAVNKRYPKSREVREWNRRSRVHAVDTSTMLDRGEPRRPMLSGHVLVCDLIIALQGSRSSGFRLRSSQWCFFVFR